MEPSGNLSVDLDDPQDIRNKLPDVRRRYAAKRRELEELEAQVRYWGQFVDLLAAMVGEKRPTERESDSGALRKSAPGQDRAVAALEKAGRPMGPSALYRFMVGENMPAPKNPNALGANLWAASRAGRVRQTPEGLYAPLSWEPPQDPLAADHGDTNANGALTHALAEDDP
jgi:hypothetical protein